MSSTLLLTQILQKASKSSFVYGWP